MEPYPQSAGFHQVIVAFEVERSRRTIQQVPVPLGHGRGVADGDAAIPVMSQLGQRKQGSMVDECRRREVDNQLTLAGNRRSVRVGRDLVGRQ